MYQTDRGAYRKNESAFRKFTHSCLGRIVILALITAIVGVVAYLTCPSEQKMNEEMNDNILQCIEERDSINTDWMDDAVNNVGYAFTRADSVITDQESIDLFRRFNHLTYFNHTFFSTMYIYNSFHVEGKRCGIGVFGLVIPTVNFKDYLIREGPLRKDYNQPVINTYGDEEYYGENPDLGGVFRYNGE